MRITFDEDGDEREYDAQNYVCAVFSLGKGYERHVKITCEGVFEEIVDPNGDIVIDWGAGHDALLPAPEEAL